MKMPADIESGRQTPRNHTCDANISAACSAYCVIKCYEGCGWRGLYHHATLTIAAYGFLISEQSAIPPNRTNLQNASSIPQLPTPRDPEQT